MEKSRTKNKKSFTPLGFAMLFTVLIISIVLAISLGVSNVVFKQTLLSGTAKLSFQAFSQADLGAECGQYFESKIAQGGAGTLPVSFDCGGKLLFVSPSGSGYTLADSILSPTDPCFFVDVTYTASPTPPPPGGGTVPPLVEIISRGYNVCDFTSLRTVERTLEITF